MRFSVNQTKFLEAITRISPAVPTKSPMPILSNILLELENNQLKMVATDLDVSILTTLEVKGETDGSISVAAKKIGDILRELDEVDLICQVDDNLNFLIEAGEGRYQVPGINSQDFPQLPDFQGALEIDVPVDKFNSIITRTAFAVSKDELRPALTGVFFQMFQNELRAVATDGHRLVRIIDRSFKSGVDQRELIIPVKALDMIKRNLTEEGEVSIVIGESQIRMELPSVTLYSRLIEGKYPHYESVIPNNNKEVLIVSSDSLLHAVKRAQIFANPISRQIVFNITENRLEITAEDLEMGGKGREVVEASYKGDEKTIGYNATYIIDILKQIETDDVQFELGGSTQAGIVRPTQQSENEDFLMLIMPVRLS